MDIKADKNIITAFALGILVTAVLLSPLWLTSGISKDEAEIIVLEKIYSDIGRDGYVVEVISAKDAGEGLIRVETNIKEIGAEKDVTYLVTKDGDILLDESVKIEGQVEKTGDEDEDGPVPTPEAIPTGSVGGAYFKGPDDAKVTIIEYSDFQCPYCARFYEGAYKQILSTYPDDVKFIYKDFPLSFHAQAAPAAEAAKCAGEQGKFWEFHDLLFDNQNEWSTVGRASFDKYAGEIGLDKDSFDSCVNARKYRTNVEAEFLEGQQKGVRGTPAFFINGKMVSGAQPFSVFQQEIDAALAAAG